MLLHCHITCFNLLYIMILRWPMQSNMTLMFIAGHITIGGSICMQMLTRSGWTPSNDIEVCSIEPLIISTMYLYHLYNKMLFIIMLTLSILNCPTCVFFYINISRFWKLLYSQYVLLNGILDKAESSFSLTHFSNIYFSMTLPTMLHIFKITS